MIESECPELRDIWLSVCEILGETGPLRNVNTQSASIPRVLESLDADAEVIVRKSLAKRFGLGLRALDPGTWLLQHSSFPTP